MTEDNIKSTWLEEQKKLKSQLTSLLKESKKEPEPKDEEIDGEKEDTEKETVKKGDSPEVSPKLREHFDHRFGNSDDNQDDHSELKQPSTTLDQFYKQEEPTSETNETIETNEQIPIPVTTESDETGDGPTNGNKGEPNEPEQSSAIDNNLQPENDTDSSPVIETESKLESDQVDLSEQDESAQSPSDSEQELGDMEHGELQYSSDNTMDTTTEFKPENGGELETDQIPDQSSEPEEGTSDVNHASDTFTDTNYDNVTETSAENSNETTPELEQAGIDPGVVKQEEVGAEDTTIPDNHAEINEELQNEKENQIAQVIREEQNLEINQDVGSIPEISETEQIEVNVNVNCSEENTTEASYLHDNDKIEEPQTINSDVDEIVTEENKEQEIGLENVSKISEVISENVESTTEITPVESSLEYRSDSESINNDLESATEHENDQEQSQDAFHDNVQDNTQDNVQDTEPENIGVEEPESQDTKIVSDDPGPIMPLIQEPAFGRQEEVNVDSTATETSGEPHSESSIVGTVSVQEPSLTGNIYSGQIEHSMEPSIEQQSVEKSTQISEPQESEPSYSTPGSAITVDPLPQSPSEETITNNNPDDDEVDNYSEEAQVEQTSEQVSTPEQETGNYSLEQDLVESMPEDDRVQCDNLEQNDNDTLETRDQKVPDQQDIVQQEHLREQDPIEQHEPQAEQEPQQEEPQEQLDQPEDHEEQEQQIPELQETTTTGKYQNEYQDQTPLHNQMDESDPTMESSHYLPQNETEFEPGPDTQEAPDVTGEIQPGVGTESGTELGTGNDQSELQDQQEIKDESENTEDIGQIAETGQESIENQPGNEIANQPEIKSMDQNTEDPNEPEPKIVEPEPSIVTTTDSVPGEDQIAEDQLQGEISIENSETQQITVNDQQELEPPEQPQQLENEVILPPPGEKVYEDPQKIEMMISQGLKMIEKLPEYVNIAREKEMLVQAADLLENNDLQQAGVKAEKCNKQINIVYNQLLSALKILKGTQKKIQDARTKGVELPIVTKVFGQAKAALKGNDFKNTVAFANLIDTLLNKALEEQ
jgi:hypothetical protein